MRLLLTPIFTLFCALTASAQIFTTTTEELRMAKTIRDDFQMERYVWAIGTGSDIESADQSALRTLAQNAMVQTTVMENSIKNVSTGSSAESSVSTSAATVGVSNIYMENVTRIILPDQNGEKVVLRYMTRENWDRRDEQLKNKIESY
ncbi:MAG: LPP20 family lipoprotein, partial [Alistipes sp.]|nr:LPP20 family lipoprotein [Alistipes sp.]